MKGQINYLNFYFDICGILLFILIAMPIFWFLFWSFHAKSYTICYIDDVKVCSRFIKVSLKGAQTSLHILTITWMNVFGKG
jgi:hypothetical protein